jgi:deoxyribodipyrimidine photo-lyase
MTSTALCWFRRDLRVSDNAALYHACKHYQRVYCVFIFDRAILDALASKADRRVEFIWQSVAALQQELKQKGGDLIVRHALAADQIPALAAELKVSAVLCNHDYEPAALARDALVEQRLMQQGMTLRGFKDTVVFEKDEVLTQAGGTFSVFTPYKNAWLKKLTPYYLKPYPVERYTQHLAPMDTPQTMPSLTQLGFESTNLNAMGVKGGSAAAAALLADFAPRMSNYKEARDYPSVKGVSYLSVHNRFGTCSIRQLVASSAANDIGSSTWRAELVWRDFYFQILWHHPHAASGNFKRAYDGLAWENNAHYMQAWCEARTGYPIIDAAMRQLNQTGYMHNRLRMIVASFLTKDLLIDWRWGEKYFADQLIDFDLAANNGGWQWAASTGCDAQPYFRIFNPIAQSERFDPEGKFIRRYLPELALVPSKYIHAPWLMPPVDQRAIEVHIGKTYPAPIVDHAAQRDQALAMYKAVRSTAPE